MYPWIKALHIVFVTSWFAGLFYLPRIFVNLAGVPAPGPERDRLLLMARKLYRFMTPLGILALGFGMWLWMGFDLPLQGWLLAKLGIVVAVTTDLADKVSAVDLVRAGSEAVGGKGGGGRPDMAQAGGPDGSRADAALQAIEAHLNAA